VFVLFNVATIPNSNTALWYLGSAKKQIDHLAYMKERIRIDRLLGLLSDVPRILSFMERVIEATANQRLSEMDCPNSQLLQ